MDLDFNSTPDFSSVNNPNSITPIPVNIPSQPRVTTLPPDPTNPPVLSKSPKKYNPTNWSKKTKLIAGGVTIAIIIIIAVVVGVLVSKWWGID